jgi:sortase (surface protein transpeptidase)
MTRYCSSFRHIVLTSAKAFADLDKIKIGDVSCITEFTEMLKYQVEHKRSLSLARQMI